LVGDLEEAIGHFVVVKQVILGCCWILSCCASGLSVISTLM
jgi:hypothetical protein